jgi:hypothetical protein
MQFAKDSFSMALRERLAALNPARTVTLSGAQRPAVVVRENEMPTAAELLSECFYIEWGTTGVAAGLSGRRPVCAMECIISYGTRGTVESGMDRGRVLGELDRELFMICQPAWTKKYDFSQSPNADLGTGVFWTTPAIEDARSVGKTLVQDAGVVGHKARITVFFYPEVESL